MPLYGILAVLKISQCVTPNDHCARKSVATNTNLHVSACRLMNTTSVVLLEQSAFRSALESFSRTVLAWSWVICTRYMGIKIKLHQQGSLSVFSLAGTLYNLCVIWTCSIGHRTGNEVFIFIISPRLKGAFSNWVVSAKCVLPVKFWTVLLWLYTKVIYFRLIYDHACISTYY